jgi:hypothetical protein
MKENRPAVIMMYRDEADILPWSLEHWYRLGVRDFYLCDNLSKDYSWNICLNFEKDHRQANVHLYKESRNDWPGRERINAMKVQAIANGCDWIFPADADEFLELGPSYYNLFMFLEQLSPDYCAYEIEYLNIYPQGFYETQKPQKKVFGKFRPEWIISMGNHLIENRQPDLIPSHCLHARYFHYSIRNFEQFKRKMMNWWTAFHNSPHQTHPHAEHYRNWQAQGDDYIKKVYDECLSKSWQ